MLNFKTLYSYNNQDFIILVEGNTCRPEKNKRELREIPIQMCPTDFLVRYKSNSMKKR